MYDMGTKGHAQQRGAAIAIPHSVPRWEPGALMYFKETVNMYFRRTSNQQYVHIHTCSPKTTGEPVRKNRHRQP